MLALCVASAVWAASDKTDGPAVSSTGPNRPAADIPPSRRTTTTTATSPMIHGRLANDGSLPWAIGRGPVGDIQVAGVPLDGGPPVGVPVPAMRAGAVVASPAAAAPPPAATVAPSRLRRLRQLRRHRRPSILRRP